MRLLVTGGAGFIGSHFVRHWLSSHPQDEVVTLDLLTYSGVRATVEELAGDPRHRFLQGDICDRAAVQQAMQGCGLVVHFAAETHVDRSITDPAPFIQTNVQGTQTLLRAAVDLKVARFVHVSTDEIYGPILKGSHPEEALLNPRSPYAASKAAGDLLVQAYRETYGLPAVIVRPTNAFGPRQFPEKFIPLCITNAMEDLPLPIYGDGLHQRSWLFVEELCQAIELIASRGALGTVYNAGSPWDLPNLEVARAILRVLRKPDTLLRFVPDRPGHDRRYAMDGSRLSRLGWQASQSFEEGLRRTIDWYRANPSWWQPLKQRLRTERYHWLPGTSAAPTGHAVGVGVPT